MPRRPVAVASVVAVLVGVGALWSVRPPAPPAVRPNIVLIVIDTLRADHLPFMGHPRDTAPFLTSLADRGVVFEHAYSTSGWTVPAVGSIFTSLYPPQHGMVLPLRVIRKEGATMQHVSSLSPAIRTLPQVLRRAGYATFAVVDNVIVSRRRNFDRGFDRFALTKNEGAEGVNARVLSWRERIAARRPYFLYLHYNDPHQPYLRRAPWFEQYAADGKVEDRREGHAVAAYDSEVRWLDDHIRALHEALGWDRDTVIVLTADHGEAFDEHGVRGHTSGLYHELLNVPLLIWGGSAGYGPRRVTAPVSHIDVLPTLRQLAGQPADPAHQGRSLVPLLVTGTGGDPRRTLFAHIRPWGGPEIGAVIEGRWKLIVHADGRRELFDIVDDPRETANRLTAEAPIAERLAENYRRFGEATAPHEATEVTAPLDPETEENLRTLGYIQ